MESVGNENCKTFLKIKIGWGIKNLHNKTIKQVICIEAPNCAWAKRESIKSTTLPHWRF